MADCFACRTVPVGGALLMFKLGEVMAYGSMVRDCHISHISRGHNKWLFGQAITAWGFILQTSVL